jgi:hypothetical protein
VAFSVRLGEPGRLPGPSAVVAGRSTAAGRSPVEDRSDVVAGRSTGVTGEVGEVGVVCLPVGDPGVGDRSPETGAAGSTGLGATGTAVPPVSDVVSSPARGVDELSPSPSGVCTGSVFSALGEVWLASAGDEGSAARGVPSGVGGVAPDSCSAGRAAGSSACGSVVRGEASGVGDASASAE